MNDLDSKMPSPDERGLDEREDGPKVPPVPSRNRVIGTKLRTRSLAERKVKCVLVGDGAVGKTSMVVSYTTNGFPSDYIPTAFDNFAARVIVDGKPVSLQLSDIAGQDEFDRLRQLCYRDADVFLLCYSVVQPISFRNLTDHWAPEIHRLCPGVPMILVGTQSDLREDVQVLIRLADQGGRPVGPDEAQLCAQDLGAVSVVECSALTQKNLKEVFDAAILCCVQPPEECDGERRRTLRQKTPEKIRTLSKSWWRKFSCLT